jgi:hypothetical protein
MTTPTDDDRAALLAELDEVTDELDQVEERRANLYARRTGIFQRARALSPPITQRELAEHARVTDAAVIQVLRKAARAGNGTT